MIVNEDRIKEIARSMDVYRRTGGAQEMYRAFEDLIETARELRKYLDLLYSDADVWDPVVFRLLEDTT
jgi:hypothetical protein